MDIQSLYTIQLSKWRIIKNTDIELIDTTTKSGNQLFSPGWDLVRAIKNNEIDRRTYTREYVEKLKYSLIDNEQEWYSILNRPKIALACYCRAGTFCHRHILAKFITRVYELDERVLLGEYE